MFFFETFYGHSTAVMDASKWNLLIASCRWVVDYYRTFIVIFVIALRFVFFCNIIVFVFIFFGREAHNNYFMAYTLFTPIYSCHNRFAVLNRFFVFVIRVDIRCFII